MHIESPLSNLEPAVAEDRTFRQEWYAWLDRLVEALHEQFTNITSALALLAPIASPIFTGDPKAPTPSAGDNDTSLATTAFVTSAISAASGAFVGTFTRDLSVATGTQAITGVGFTPRAVLFFGSLPSSTVISSGMSDAVNHAGMANNISGALANSLTTKCIRIEPSSGNHQEATIQSMDANGFTLSWIKTGTPTGTANIAYLAVR